MSSHLVVSSRLAISEIIDLRTESCTHMLRIFVKVILKLIYYTCISWESIGGTLFFFYWEEVGE